MTVAATVALLTMVTLVNMTQIQLFLFVSINRAQDTQHDDIQHNDTEYNDTQHKN